MAYENFLDTLFGSHYRLHLPFIYSIKLYCLYVVTLVVVAFVYSQNSIRSEYDRTFQERVRDLRFKYAFRR